nr:immunoglobulin heavy chain junction region [Mus musculus]MBK4188851.1 immunoglobulin heavy chain junction region [Mus musculus]
CARRAKGGYYAMDYW